MRAEVIKKVIVKEETEIIVDSIDIPSVEDLKDIPSSFLSIGECWWLSTPAASKFNEMTVDEKGALNERGEHTYLSLGIRPMLTILAAPGAIKRKDRLSFAGYEWYMLTPTKALCRRNIATHPFKKDQTDPETANDYKQSDLKKWLDKWLMKVTRNLENEPDYYG